MAAVENICLMEPIIVVIATNVRHYRKKAVLSQEKLAERAGLHRTYIGGIERGEYNVTAGNIARIARALDVEPFILLVEKRTGE